MRVSKKTVNEFSCKYRFVYIVVPAVWPVDIVYLANLFVVLCGL